MCNNNWLINERLDHH